MKVEKVEKGSGYINFMDMHDISGKGPRPNRKLDFENVSSFGVLDETEVANLENEKGPDGYKNAYTGNHIHIIHERMPKELIPEVALLYDETATTFSWLFDTFVIAMSGKNPQTILTDQDAAMAKALASRWPNTYHHLCMWHINQNATIHLSSIFAEYKEFARDFSSCMYDHEDEEEFIDAWNKMIVKHSLQNNDDWLQRMFQLRKKWVLVYGRETFCADMSTTQRSESMNNVIKKYILKHASTVYALKIFELFQAELCKAHDCNLEICNEKDTMLEFKVASYEVDASMENRFVEKSTLDPKCGGKQTINTLHNKEIVLDRVENSSSNVRGLKVKQNPRVTSGKRPKDGLEKVATEKKSKNNKESSIINEHNGQTYQVSIPDLSLSHTDPNMAYVPPHSPRLTNPNIHQQLNNRPCYIENEEHGTNVAATKV
ncbi:hypothetical protein BUALT_Bualt06G0062900 [Buddleja alternifolia]|uniref:Protein FAR1-RELATED SEQUENCE n=1 Tax=Buddleja alternifolia TaxID=168488 RepID=A0AAV6XLI3_9LAMI|nr:hypothetical protein BUALT_Bualt06G0062900 [Buddleja alternifolia]